MENRKRALGMGLEELFNNENLDLEKMEEKIYETASKEEIIELSLDELRPNPYQPRKNFKEEALDELTESIKVHGIFQPIIVKKSIKGYEIVAGERRFRASKKAGLTTIPAIIRPFTDEQMMEIALLENLQRENLSVIEEASAYQKMIQNLNLTQDEVAKKVGKSRSYVTNIIGLLRLPQEVIALIDEEKISMGHARVLSKLEDQEKIIAIARKIASDKMTVRDIEEMTKEEKLEKKVKINRVSESNEYKYVEDLLRDKLDTKVKIKNSKIMINFTTTADLNRILEILDVKEWDCGKIFN